MEWIFDFDNTLANTDLAIFRLYREQTGDLSTKMEDRNNWWYNKDICPLWSNQDQNDAFLNPRLFELTELNDGAFDFIDKLLSNGEKVTIATVHNPDGIAYKAKYIKKNIPIIKRTVFIDNGVEMDKSIITGDIIVDDAIGNLTTAKVILPICFGSYGWNKEWTGLRADTFKKLNDLYESKIIEDLVKINCKSKR